MKRFISNYTITSRGEEFINHITTVDDEGRLVSIQPFDRELGNTIYVPEPLCVVATNDALLVERAFGDSASREQLKQRLIKQNTPQLQIGTPVLVLRLNFAHNILNRL